MIGGGEKSQTPQSARLAKKLKPAWHTSGSASNPRPFDSF